MKNLQSQTEITNKLLTPEQAAELLQVSKRTMYEWLRNGEIPCERIGDRLIRIRENDLLSPDVRVYFEQGCKLAQHPSTVDRAAEFFYKAIELNPRYALAYFELGRMFYQWSHFDRAIEPLKKAIELNPTFPAYMNLGMNCYRGVMYDEAEKAFRKALELEPACAVAHFELGCVIQITSFYDKTRLIEAIEHFRTALENQPNYNLAARHIGEILVLRFKDFEGAIIFANEIEETFPDIAKHTRLLVQLNLR